MTSTTKVDQQKGNTMSQPEAVDVAEALTRPYDPNDWKDSTGA